LIHPVLALEVFMAKKFATFDDYLEACWDRYDRLYAKWRERGLSNSSAQSLGREAMRVEWENAQRINRWLDGSAITLETS
jgi:hypothetical protein